MDQFDVATFTTAVLILVFFFQALTLWSPQHEQGAVKKPRRLRPRTPEDCPYCGDEHERHCHPMVRLRRQPIPYKERKSRRGRPKEKQTEGYCCWNLGCEYYGIRNADIHAIVGDGHHGKSEAIQDYTCQWVRRDRPQSIPIKGGMDSERIRGSPNQLALEKEQVNIACWESEWREKSLKTPTCKTRVTRQKLDCLKSNLRRSPCGPPLRRLRAVTVHTVKSPLGHRSSVSCASGQ